MITNELTQAVSFVFDSASTTDDGAVVVVKRSTDPVRVNNSSFSVAMSGLAPGAYRLVSDKTKFHLNNMTSLAASLSSGSSGNFEIYGDTPSTAMFDATLSLKTVEGTTLCTTNITILWVDISMRCGQNDDFSTDNGCVVKPSPAKLGAQRGFVGGVEVNMGNNVEFIGTVHPSDFTLSILMNRDNTNEMLVAKLPNGSWNLLSYHPVILRDMEPECNDETDPQYQDWNPMPNGRVFDFAVRMNHPEDNSCGMGASPLVVY